MVIADQLSPQLLGELIGRGGGVGGRNRLDFRSEITAPLVQGVKQRADAHPVTDQQQRLLPAVVEGAMAN